MKHNIAINDDYAGIWINNDTYLYYGYEYTWDTVLDVPYEYSDESEDNDTEWCFVVIKDRKMHHQVRASILSPNSKSDHHEVDRMLLRGISWWIQTENLL